MKLIKTNRGVCVEPLTPPSPRKDTPRRKRRGDPVQRGEGVQDRAGTHDRCSRSVSLPLPVFLTGRGWGEGLAHLISDCSGTHVGPAQRDGKDAEGCRHRGDEDGVQRHDPLLCCPAAILLEEAGRRLDFDQLRPRPSADPKAHLAAAPIAVSSLGRPRNAGITSRPKRRRCSREPEGPLSRMRSMPSPRRASSLRAIRSGVS